MQKAFINTLSFLFLFILSFIKSDLISPMDNSIVIEETGPGYKSIEIISTSETKKLPKLMKKKNLQFTPLNTAITPEDILNQVSNPNDQYTSIGRSLDNFFHFLLNDIMNTMDSTYKPLSTINNDNMIVSVSGIPKEIKDEDLILFEKNKPKNHLIKVSSNKIEAELNDKEANISTVSIRKKDSKNIPNEAEKLLAEEWHKRGENYPIVIKESKKHRIKIYKKIALLVVIFYISMGAYLIYLHFRENKKMEEYNQFNFKHSINEVNSKGQRRNKFL